MQLKSIADVDVQGKRVLVRGALNARVDSQGRLYSDFRLRSMVPTLNHLRERGAKIIICGHLGRPAGKRVQKYTLKNTALRLEQLLGVPVPKMNTTVGKDAHDVARLLKPGEVMLLENTRFDLREEANDIGFARELAALADIYCFEGFDVAHRAHASVERVATLLPAYAGLRTIAEVDMLERALVTVERPLVIIVGGVKFASKVGMIDRLAHVADRIVIGGELVGTFLAAMNANPGRTQVEVDFIPVAKNLIDRLGDKLVVAPDGLVKGFYGLGKPKAVDWKSVPSHAQVMDIGPATIETIRHEIAQAKTIFWNGPMGVFEQPPFDAGTKTVARMIAEHYCVSIVGGGETVDAIGNLGLENGFTHISIGGASMIQFLAGKEMPGLQHLLT